MANKHYVICARCGKQFDANRGASFNPHTGRYVCKGCINAQTTGMRQSYGAMIATDFSATVTRSGGFWSVLRTAVGVKNAKAYAKNFAVNYIAISIFVGVMALIGTGILFAVFGLL